MTLLSRETIFLKGLKGKKWLATPLVVSRLIAAIFNTEHIEYHCNYNFPSLRAIFSFVLLSPYVRESTKVLDSGSQLLDSDPNIWILDFNPLNLLDSGLHTKVDSGLQTIVHSGF